MATMPPQQIAVRAEAFGTTQRADRWWIAPLTTAAGLVLFFGYLTVRAFIPNYVWYPPYISPTVAPPLFTPATGYAGAVPVDHAWFGAFPSWWPPFLPQSPSFFLPALAIAFRATCYYYRGAYYKAFWADPPNCAVGEPRKGYIGESNWPLRIQNIHRYFLYLAILFLFMLGYDAICAFWFKDANGQGSFGIGVGSLVLTINVILLTGYTLGCHSLRHLVGGRRDCMTDSPLCQKAYKGCSALNKRHMLWAWVSLVGVMFADIYVRLCSMGVWKDIRIL